MLGALFAPLLVGLGENVLYAKVLPSILSAIAAFCTAWLQLRNYGQFIEMYRDRYEVQITHFDINMTEYTGLGESKASKLLVLTVSNLVLETSSRWTKHVPNPSNLKLESN
ncbi:DUF4231 domain-containing protein [Photobacterium phosphoreum]|nr:DUF4231 domain-containing protein [Photobacterium phosphoreum]PSU60725.1 DUF4231 domain-containing protein [Photobacterium phosphoreum]